MVKWFNIERQLASNRGKEAADNLKTRWPRQLHQQLADASSAGSRLENTLQVFVRDNNVDQALRVLKKKMQREGVFREMKRRKAYEKPSERKTREKAEAIRRARKAARKQAQREGLIPMPKRKEPPPRRAPRPFWIRRIRFRACDARRRRARGTPLGAFKRVFRRVISASKRVFHAT
jgi:small subunit ribosomal protein S21